MTATRHHGPTIFLAMVTILTGKVNAPLQHCQPAIIRSMIGTVWHHALFYMTLFL